MKFRAVVTASRPFFLLASFAWAMGSFAPDAVACSCTSGSRASEFDRASDVFVGTVVEGPTPAHEDVIPHAGVHGHDAEDPAHPNAVAFGFDVTESLKGRATGHVTVVTHADASACGVAFKPGTKYLVFARQGAHGLHTDTCMGTIGASEGMEQALPDVRKLAAFLRGQETR